MFDVGFSFFSNVFPFIFMVLFCLVLGLFVFNIFRMLKTWNTNNNSPKITSNVKIVSKRMSVHRHDGVDDTSFSHTSTTYYATFEFETGDRLELQIPNQLYGYLVEGDIGKLTFQGTRFLNFER